MSVSRTKGIDLDDEAAQRLFAGHLPLSQIHPKELWKLSKVTRKGQTSDWDAMQKAYSFLSALLDATGGRIPHINSFSLQMGSFLKTHWCVWRLIDLEFAVDRLRSMLGALRRLGRAERLPPTRHRNLSMLVAKMISSTDDAELEMHVGISSTDDAELDLEDLEIKLFAQMNKAQENGQGK